MYARVSDFAFIEVLTRLKQITRHCIWQTAKQEWLDTIPAEMMHDNSSKLFNLNATAKVLFNHTFDGTRLGRAENIDQVIAHGDVLRDSLCAHGYRFFFASLLLCVLQFCFVDVRLAMELCLVAAFVCAHECSNACYDGIALRYQWTAT